MVQIGYTLMSEQRDPKDLVVDGVRMFADSGSTHVALVQIGPNQQGFCDASTGELGNALRAA